MLICIFLALLTRVVLADATSPSRLFSQCSWVSNITGMVRVEEIGKHKYMILEDCLYYNLSMKADRALRRFNSLSELPPTREGQSTLMVTIDQLVLKELYTSKLSPKMRMTGHMTLSWFDFRLEWDPTVWKINQLTVKSEEDIWVPEPTSFGSGQLLQRISNAIVFHNIMISYKGQVTATLEFSVSTACQNDHRNFPMDLVNCCVYSYTLLDDEILTYSVNNRIGSVEIDTFSMRWSVKQFYIDVVRDQTSSRDQSPSPWRMCVEATRYSKTMKMQLSIPMAISGILVVVAPLFGTMQTQIFVKIFSLLMQLICFQFLVTLTPAAGLGNEMPRIYKFYETTFAITFISLLITVILKALSRIERSIPPSHSLFLLARTFNAYVCCSNQKAENTQTATQSDQSSKEQTDSGTNQWSELFVALNNAISSLLIAVYVIAALILSS